MNISLFKGQRKDLPSCTCTSSSEGCGFAPYQKCSKLFLGCASAPVLGPNYFWVGDGKDYCA